MILPVFLGIIEYDYNSGYKNNGAVVLTKDGSEGVLSFVHFQKNFYDDDGVMVFSVHDYILKVCYSPVSSFNFTGMVVVNGCEYKIENGKIVSPNVDAKVTFKVTRIKNTDSDAGTYSGSVSGAH